MITEEQRSQIEKLLDHYKWLQFGECECGGTYYQKYYHPELPSSPNAPDNLDAYELWISPEIGSFRMYNADKEQCCEERDISRLNDTIYLNSLF